MSILAQLLQEADTLRQSSDQDAVKAACDFVEKLTEQADNYRQVSVLIPDSTDPAAAPEDIPRLMHHLGDQIMCSRYTVHPIEMAAMACKRLTDIQPFTSNNTTLAIELLNLILSSSGYPMIHLTNSSLLEYHRTMSTTRLTRDMEPFSIFIAKQILICAAHSRT